MRKLFMLTAVGAFLMTASPCRAAVPQLINFQGMLTDDEGNPLSGAPDLTFSIYSDSAGGTLLWDEIHTAVPVENGLFNVILGETTPIPDSVFDQPGRFLGMKVGNDPELTPRIQFTSVAYAYRAGWVDTSDYSFQSQRADTAFHAIEAVTAETDNDWTLSGQNIYRLNGNVGIGTAAPTQKLDVADTVQMAGFKMPQGASDGYVLTSDISGAGSWQVLPDGGSHWSPADSVLYTDALWGIARGGAYNALYGSSAHTMVNLGVACTTGASGQDYVYSTVAGGHKNRATLNYATVGGGVGNTAGSEAATVGGGEGNAAVSMYATVPGGYRNKAAGIASFAAGGEVAVEPLAQYTFAFGRGCTTSTANAVIFYNSEEDIKVGIQTTSPERALHIKDVLRLEPRSSAPPNPAEGDIYVNSTDHAIYCYLDGEWKPLNDF